MICITVKEQNILKMEIWYSGNFINNFWEGTGTSYLENGDILYEGQFHDSEFHGIGKLFKNKKIYYEGSMKEGIPDGLGIYYFDHNQKIKYRGELNKGVAHGYGTSYYENGNIFYHGHFRRGYLYGYGVGYHQDGRLHYTGYFKDNLKDKRGILYSYHDESKIYEGEFKEDKYNGLGILYENGNILYEGEFKNGHFMNGEISNEEELKNYYIEKEKYEKIHFFCKKYKIQDFHNLLYEGKLMDISNLFFEEKENIPNGTYLEIQNLLMSFF